MIRFIVQLLLESAVGGQAAGPIEYVLMALIALALVAVAVALVWRGPAGPRRTRTGRRGEGLLTCCVAVVALLIALHGMWAAIVAFVALAAFTLKLRTTGHPSRPESNDERDGGRVEEVRR